MSEKLQLPHFASEAEEAQWWYDNREAHAERFAKAIEEGRATRGTLKARLDRVQLNPEDADKAREIARSKGMEYQTFVKNLVHEVLFPAASSDH